MLTSQGSTDGGGGRERTGVLGYSTCYGRFQNKTVKSTHKQVRSQRQSVTSTTQLADSVRAELESPPTFLIPCMGSAPHIHAISQQPLATKLTPAGEAVSTGACNRPALHTVYTYCILVQGGGQTQNAVSSKLATDFQ